VGGFYTQSIGTLDYQLCTRTGSSRPRAHWRICAANDRPVARAALVAFEPDLQRNGVRYELSQGENEALGKLRLGRLQAVVLERRQVERLGMLPEELRCEPGGMISVQR
jgi:hypothetical protein